MTRQRHNPHHIKLNLHRTLGIHSTTFQTHAEESNLAQSARSIVHSLAFTQRSEAAWTVALTMWTVVHATAKVKNEKMGINPRGIEGYNRSNARKENKSRGDS